MHTKISGVSHPFLATLRCPECFGSRLQRMLCGLPGSLTWFCADCDHFSRFAIADTGHAPLIPSPYYEAPHV